MWDTTGRSPKVSWLKQHSAPTTGICFSPSNDKMVVSVGLDKKLYTFDPGMKKQAYCTPCEAPFSSLAFKDDGLILAAGTNTGRIVFYDVRGKPQPLTILHAYNNSEAVTSLCWQRSKPILVNEANCLLESALLGAAREDSILMLDPLPPSTSLSHGSTSMSTTPARTSGRFSFSTTEGSPISASGISVTSVATRSSPGEEYQGGNHLRTNGTVSRLQTQNNFSFKDDMEVFYPLVDV
jgi:protein NEDD1